MLSADRTRASAIQFSIEDILLMHCESEAAAQVYSTLLDEAQYAAAHDSPEALRSYRTLMTALHSKLSDAELEALYTCSAVLDLTMRGNDLWISQCLLGRQDDV